MNKDTKASELVEILQSVIKAYGDLPIRIEAVPTKVFWHVQGVSVFTPHGEKEPIYISIFPQQVKLG